MGENFIEIWHEDRDCTSSYHATRTQHKWKDGSPSVTEGWQVQGSTIYVYDKEDITALRKLLNAIEERLEDNNS